MPSESLAIHCKAIFVKGYKMHAEINYRIKMGVEIENYEIASKRFENTFRAMGFRNFRSLWSKSTGGAFKGLYKSESL